MNEKLTQLINEYWATRNTICVASSTLQKKELKSLKKTIWHLSAEEELSKNELKKVIAVIEDNLEWCD